MDFLITYLKKDGTYLNRTIRSIPTIKIGDITSMGWKVIDIQIFYNKRYYSYEEYKKIFKKDYKKFLEKEKRKSKRNNFVDFVLYHNFNIKK